MNNKYRALYAGFSKQAVAALTPEAMQAAQAPMPPQGAPMDPAVAGGAMPPQGAPMDPAAAGVPADPTMMGGATGPNGGAIPPEILQDQEFMAFLEQMLGIVFDPQAQIFVDPQGQAVPAEAIVQAYQQFQMEKQQMQQTQQGGAPGALPPEASGAMPPEAAAAMPPSPEGEGVPPEAAGAVPPEAVVGAPVPTEGDMPADPTAQMADMVLSAVETVINEALSAQEKKLSTLLDKVDTLKKDIDAVLNSDNKRSKEEDEKEGELRGELEQELANASAGGMAAPAPQAMMDVLPKAASASPSAKQRASALALFNLVTKRG